MGFMSVIIIGALLLSLPVASNTGGSIGSLMHYLKPLQQCVLTGLWCRYRDNLKPIRSNSYYYSNSNWWIGVYDHGYDGFLTSGKRSNLRTANNPRSSMNSVCRALYVQ